jgi:hypothetical protein
MNELRGGKRQAKFARTLLQRLKRGAEQGANALPEYAAQKSRNDSLAVARSAP